jgi:hypothetical protein
MNSNITNINIETTNLNKHVDLNFEGKNNNIYNTENDELFKTKIINYNFFSINEVNICNKIKSIPYYSIMYSIIEDYDFININQLNEKYIEKINLTNNNKYLIFKYKNEDLINLNEYLFNFTTPKFFILNSITSFSTLLKSVVKLNTEGICMFDLSPQNIGFNLNCGENLIIKNFQMSLHLSKLNECYIENIIKEIKDFVYKPLEVHILFYLIQNNLSTISYSLIEEISEIFIKNLYILNLFSEKYKEAYKLSIIETLKKYLNKSKSFIIMDIIKNQNKWDVYSLSVLYLHIFGNFSRVFSLTKNVINKIIFELSINIHPDPCKRSSLENFLERIETILCDEKDWSFVNNLPTEKMIQLFNILEK